MKKLYMTRELANSLMDLLCCVAISANGGCPMENGKIVMTEEQKNLAADYATMTFCNILEEWTDEDERWVIRG